MCFLHFNSPKSPCHPDRKPPMKVKLFAAAAVVAVCVLASQAHATTIDFEDVATPLGGGQFAYLTTQYGLTWTGIYDDYSVVVSPDTSIYFSGTAPAHSGKNFAWSGGSTEFTIEGAAFTLNSLWMRTPWATAPLQVKGFKNGVELYSASMSISGTYEQKIFNFVGVDKVTFYGNNSGNLIFDDMVINEVAAVPEPATYGMLLAGLGLVGAAGRRRRR